MLPRRYAALNCSIARSLEIVGDRWTMLVLRNALVGQTRFEQFATSLGVASNVLTDRLARLTDEGIVERRAYQEKPVRHEYVITEKGRELWPVLVALVDWGDRHHAPDGPPRLVVHAGCGGRLRQHLTCADCGAEVSTDAIDTRPGPGSVIGSAS
ncbi:MAG: winged helix-turn-helix transcriptional regulator [Actinomycetota bacterium]|nr:winged helix-turn-helix transcriptional regulator [Actinomycetota bacterium]